MNDTSLFAVGDRGGENDDTRKKSCGARGGMALLFAASFARDTGAQGYPSKPIRYLLPTSGQTEANGRLVASGLSDGLDQQFYVDVRSGKTPRA